MPTHAKKYCNVLNWVTFLIYYISKLNRCFALTNQIVT